MKRPRLKWNRLSVLVGTLIVTSVVAVAMRTNAPLIGESRSAESILLAQNSTGPFNGFDLSHVTIPLDEIRAGGPPRDGIPAILDPKFVAAREATFLTASDTVVGLTSGSKARAYPFRILVWHEIVNDTFDDQPVMVTYCPLCGTAMVFDRRTNSREYTFGVSGLLYNSDVLMYDHQTESLWSQLKMEAVSGEMVGTPLEWKASTQTSWGAWRAQHPNTEVLSPDTGFRRNYQNEPYQSYKKSDTTIFPVPVNRTELEKKEWVVGVIVDGTPKAYPLSAFESAPGGVIDDSISGQAIRLTRDAEADHVSVSDPSGEEIPSVRVYWFAWQAFYPDTLLYAPGGSR